MSLYNISRKNTNTSRKKHIFSRLERELIVALVRERPVVEDKGNDSVNRELRRQAWEDVATVFNDQPNVTQRTSIQLKKCWENMKSLRKKELFQKSVTGVSAARGFRYPSFDSISLDKVGDPYISVKEPSVSDPMPTANGILKVEVGQTSPVPEGTVEDEGDRQYPVSETVSEPLNDKCHSEIDGDTTRCYVNKQQEQLLELKIQREHILLEREKNNLAYDKKFQELQLEKIRLEIELLKKRH